MKRKRDTSELEVTSKISSDVFESVGKDMEEVFGKEANQAQSSTTPEKGKVPKTQAKAKAGKSEEQLAAEKEFRKTRQEVVTALNKFTNLLDRYSGELAESEFIKTQMTAKGLPDTMHHFVDEKVKPMKEKIASLQTLKASFRKEIEGLTTNASCEHVKITIANQMAELKDEWEKFEKDAWKDIKPYGKK